MAGDWNGDAAGDGNRARSGARDAGRAGRGLIRCPARPGSLFKKTTVVPRTMEAAVARHHPAPGDAGRSWPSGHQQAPLSFQMFHAIAEPGVTPVDQ
ncbi:hypothetical protein GCM10009839_30930 [Catenulispora yoronensis]|uniref:Uncharacterized protein n=1 Tax=Catenulispora yoronensis TaxID=450799 RepID=A0ABP5FQ81_9ACTN